MNHRIICLVLLIIAIQCCHRISCVENTTNGTDNESDITSTPIPLNIPSNVSPNTNIKPLNHNILDRELDSNALYNISVPEMTVEPLVNSTSLGTTPAPVVTNIANTTILELSAIPNNTSVSELSPKRKYHPNRVRSVEMDVHQTNMQDNDVDKCRTVMNNTLSNDYGSRKTARLLKEGLDEAFSAEKYRFSIIITSNVTNIIAKRLYGVWMSMTANNKHYLLMASYKAVKAKKLTEGQLDRIEDWTSVYFITYENMTEKTQYSKVAKMLREKLDLNYGKGNTWAVIAFKSSTALRAKRLFEGTPQIQFKRLDGSVWFTFRGGEDIPSDTRYENLS